MTNKKFLIIFSLIAIAVVSFFVSSCDIKSPTEGLEVRLKGIERTTSINVQIIDAANGDQINQQVNVKFEGSNTGLVINDVNQQISSLSTTTGNVTFSLKDEIIPSENNPITLVLLFTSSGYINSSKQLTITKTGGSIFNVFLVSVTNTPNGVVTNVIKEGNTGSGGLSADLKVESGTEPNSNSGASITIPAGTQLLDENGNVLTGDVETRVTYFNPVTQSSLNSFPGGFDVTVEDNTGQQQDVQFVTAGFIAVDMTVNQVTVAGFSQNVTLTFDIPEGLNNPEFGEPVKVGDKIPLWSYDETNGKWKWEGDYTVPTRSLKNGKLQIVKNDVRHLSWWNLDWYYNMCYYGATIKLEGCFNILLAKLKRASDGGIISYYYIYPGDSELKFYRAPENLPVIVEFYEYIGYYQDGPKLDEVLIDDLCIQQTYTANVNVTGYREVTVNITGKCTKTDPPRVFYPQGIPLYYKIEGTYSWTYAGLIGSTPYSPGQIKLCLKEDTDYIFTAYIDGRWYYSSDYPDAPKRLEPGKNVYNFIVEDPEVGDFCN